MQTVIRSTVFVLALLVIPNIAVANEDGVTSAQPSEMSAQGDVQDEKCKKPLYISGVFEDELKEALQYIRTCLPPTGKLEVFVSGPGGPVDPAIAFFDQIRTQGLNKRLRFIHFGPIESASNIVWMAADERVVTPSSFFMVHKGTVSARGMDFDLLSEYNDVIQKNATNVILEAAGKRAAEFWSRAASGKDKATIFTGKQAVELGWATRLEEYK